MLVALLPDCGISRIDGVTGAGVPAMTIPVPPAERPEGVTRG